MRLVVLFRWMGTAASLTLLSLVRAAQHPFSVPTFLPPSDTNKQEAPRAAVWPLSTRYSHQQPFPLSSRQADIGAPSATPQELQWTLTNANGSIAIPALFPSLAHLDLLRARIIEEPAIGLNEGLDRWVIDEPCWTYSADLSPLLAHAAKYDRLHLCFEGLDTIADVFVGEELVGSSNDQHLFHVFDVTSAVRRLASSVDRNLTIRFHNVNEYAAKQAQHGLYYPDQREAPSTSRSSRYQYPNRMFVRKQQSDFGWDWGPALVPAGPHKPAWLIGLERKEAPALEDGVASPSSFFLQRVSFDIYRIGQVNNLPPDQDANWIVNVTLNVLSSRHVETPRVRLAIDELDLYTFDAVLSSPVRPGFNQDFHASFELPSVGRHGPRLWWPTGSGRATMYNATVRSDELKFEVHRRIGFRTAVLNQEPVTATEKHEGWQPGSKFQIEINGVPIYVQGTNVIPFDTLGPRASPAYVRWLLQSVVAAGQNLIRIWGGGSYPPPWLLEACDELGIMVWVDGMFAASLYPADAPFLSLVREEVRQVVPVLTSHPSVVATVGNNEGELYFLGGYGRLDNDTLYLAQYDELFNVVIRDAVLSSSRSLSYIPCSTTTGYLSLYPHYVPRYAARRQGELYGTGENYNYDMTQSFNRSTYPRSRFMVEFGMHSMPSIYSWDAVLTSEEEYEFNGTQVQNHDKHMPAGSLVYPWNATEGQAEMTRGVEENFPTPVDRGLGRRRDTLAQWSYSTQCFQAAFVGAQILSYRRGATARERNRGVVVWQLNDVWQGTSWSSIEYGGRWKMMHYMSARTQDRIVAAPLYDAASENLEIHVLSDYRADDAGPVHATVIWTWYDFDGAALSSPSRAEVVLRGHDSRLVFNATGLDNVLPSPPPGGDVQRRRGAFLHVTVSHRIPSTSTDHGREHIGQRQRGRRKMNEHFLSPFKLRYAPLRDPNLSLRPLTHDGLKGHWFDLTCNGPGVAAWVSIEHPEGVVGYFVERLDDATAGDASEARRGAAEEETEEVPSMGFWMRPGETRRLRFVVADELEGQQLHSDTAWMNRFTVRSMWDNRGQEGD